MYKISTKRKEINPLATGKKIIGLNYKTLVLDWEKPFLSKDDEV